VKPIIAAATASITVLPTARITSDSTGAPGRDRVAEIAVDRAPQPQPELHRQRAIETIGRAQLRGELLRGIGRQHRDPSGSPGVICTSRKHTSATLSTIGMT
jgi:hypothetical protein